MRRRQFLTASLAGSACLLAGPLGHASAGRRLDTIGLQLSTLNGPMAGDFEGSLRQVADIGYRQVEFSTLSGFAGRSPEAVKGLLDDLGLRAPLGRLRPQMPADLSGLPPAELMKLFMERGGTDNLLDNLEAMLPEARVMQYKSIVLSAVPPTETRDRASLERLAGIFDAAGALCAEHGMTFGYHNHDFDFRPVEGVLPYEYLLQNTDPARVRFQLDLYWISKAGEDPIRYLSQYGDRIQSCHMKDMGPDGQFADVGAGTLDYPAMTRAAVDAGVRYFFVEHDRPRDAIATARNSYNYLHNLRF